MRGWFRRILGAIALAGATAAQASGGYYEYIAAPDTPAIYGGKINFTVESTQQFGATFFVLRHETIGGPWWDSTRHDIHQEATLTTDALGKVIAWNVVGQDINRYIEYYWSSSFVGGVFKESYRSEEGVVWGCLPLCETSADSTTPGTWRYVAAPVPEPLAIWLAISGAGILFAGRRRKAVGVADDQSR